MSARERLDEFERQGSKIETVVDQKDALIAALRAVLNLHQEDMRSYGYCKECIDYRWPCQTVKVIEEALK